MALVQSTGATKDWSVAPVKEKVLLLPVLLRQDRPRIVAGTGGHHHQRRLFAMPATGKAKFIEVGSSFHSFPRERKSCAYNRLFHGFFRVFVSFVDKRFA